MKLRRITLALATIGLLGPLAAASRADTLLAYWDFNNYTSHAATVSPTFDLLGGALITIQNPTPNINTAPTPANPGTTLNATLGSVAGNSLQLNSRTSGNTSPPNQLISSREVLIEFSTVGFEDIVLSFAANRGANEGGSYQLSEILFEDGMTFVLIEEFTPALNDPAGTWSLHTFDLSAASSAVNNNAGVQVLIRLQNPDSDGGATRLDNLQVVSVPEPWSIASLGMMALVGVACIARRRMRS